jgi:hypothetical protein
MADVKPVASLGATLLARKGGAKPAMRPQVATTALGGAQAAQKLAANLEDLGWNDMGEEDSAPDRSAEVLQLTPAPHNPKAEAKTDEGSPRALVRSMHEELAARLANEDESDYVVAKEKPKPAEPAPPSPTAPVAAMKAPVAGEAVAEAVEAVADKAPPAEAKRPLASRPSADSRRAAFTLRLDAKRHLKLRLASTIRNRSAQQLVTEALDRFLSDIPEIELLARNIQKTDRKGV